MSAVSRLGTVTLAALLAGLLLLLATGTAAAHDELVGSDPADGASLATPPSKITLQFSLAVRDQFATITVIGPDGAAYQDGSPTAAGTAVSVAVRPLGPAGRYTVGYRVVSNDGHPVQGVLGFTLTAAGAAAATAPSASTAPSTAAQPATDSGAGSAPVWPWVLGGVVLVAGGAAVALRQSRR